MLKTICVYCASSTQVDDSYFKVAEELGKTLADNKLELVYGAGCIGLMGEVADSALQNGGKVTGIIPQFMIEMDWHHKNLSSLIVVDSMHERKEKMASLADAAIALPGGCGTMEELLEIITWKQLGLFLHPIIIVNTNNYYEDLIKMLEKAICQNFMRDVHLRMWTVVDKVEDIIPAIQNAEKWDTNTRKFAAI